MRSLVWMNQRPLKNRRQAAALQSQNFFGTEPPVFAKMNA